MQHPAATGFREGQIRLLALPPGSRGGGAPPVGAGRASCVADAAVGAAEPIQLTRSCKVQGMANSSRDSATSPHLLLLGAPPAHRPHQFQGGPACRCQVYIVCSRCGSWSSRACVSSAVVSSRHDHARCREWLIPLGIQPPAPTPSYGEHHLQNLPAPGRGTTRRCRVCIMCGRCSSWSGRACVGSAVVSS